WHAVSPDGRVLALAGVRSGLGAVTVGFFELATGSELGRLPTGHRGRVGEMAFSPDGQLLATAGADTSILVWDWEPYCGLRGTPGAKVGAKRLSGLWDDLASPDGRRGYAAVGTLAAYPDQAVPFLKKHLGAVTEADCRPVRRWLTELDSDDFAASSR